MSKQLNIGLHQEARNAIILLHDAVYEFYNYTDNENNNINFEDNQAIKDHIVNANKLFHTIRKAYSRVILFIEYNHKIERLTLEILLLFFKEIFIPFEDFYNDIMRLNDKYYEKTESEDLKDYYDSQANLLKTYLSNLLVALKTIDPKLEEFSKELRNYLNINIKSA